MTPPPEAAEHRRALMEALHDTTLGLLDRTDPEGLLEDIARRAARLVGAADAYVYLPDERGAKLVVRMAVGAAAADFLGTTLRPGEGAAGRAWLSGEPIVVKDYQTWEGRSESIRRRDVHAVAALPLRAGGRVAGVLGVYHRQPGLAFGAEEVDLLQRFADLASVALDHATLIRALRDSEAIFRTAFERAPHGRAVALPDGRWLRANPELCRILGRGEDELRGLTFLEVTHPDDRPRNAALVEDMVAGRSEGYEMEKRFVRGDGSQVWVRATVSLVRDDAGQPLYLIGDVEDLTERRRAQEEARRHAVTRGLVRRMLRDLARQTPIPRASMRKLGRSLASGVEGRDLAEYVAAFAAMGLGELALESDGQRRAVVQGKDLIELAPHSAQPTCHLALGFVEGALAAVSEGEALGTELRCESMGHERCVFVVARRGAG